MDQERLKHLTELADPALRGEAALRVAAHYGVDSIILFVRDDAIGISLPANGFPQTLPNGSGWQAFVKRCVEAGTASETLAIPGSPLPQTVTGIACKTGAVMAFIGGELLKDAYTDIPMILPVLDLALKGEQVVRIAQANALLATERIGVAHRLAESLDKARLDLAKTLIESRAAQQELKMADQRKNEFLALLAHELRNPLAPIGNALELLRVSIENPAMVAKVREIMQTQFTQMVHLIDDLMDVSRISTGKILLKKEVLNISEVLLNAVEAAKPHIDLNQHKLDIHLPAVSSVVFADRTRLNQVFLNILNNAAKFTPAGGRITVSASISANHIDVHVTDTGKGVPKEIAKQIFTMFAQGDDTISRTTGGLGIGLGLAKKLVELHGGTISVASEGKNLGSTFTVHLPLYKGDASEREVETSIVAASGEGLRVLVVDDNQDSAKTMGWTLEALGHKYRLAFDGQSAIQAGESYLPQLVLLDIGLPGMTGYEVCTALKTLPALRDTLFVAQTGWGQPEDKEKARLAGFNHHLVKPVDIRELQKIIDGYRAGAAAGTSQN